MSSEDLLRQILVDDELAAREKAERKYRIQAKLEPVNRFVAIGLVAAVAFASRYLGFTGFSYYAIALSTVLALVVHGGLTWWVLMRWLRAAPWVYDVVTWMDFLLITVGVYFTGGESSVLFFIYLVRIADQITASPRRILYFLVLYVFSYGAMLGFIIIVDGGLINWKLEAFKFFGLSMSAVYLYIIGVNVQTLKSRLAFFIREARRSIKLSERRRNELMQTDRLVEVINRKTEFRDFLDELISQIRSVMACDQVAVLVRDKSHGNFRIELSSGFMGWNYEDEIPANVVEKLEGVKNGQQEEVTIVEDDSYKRLVLCVSVDAKAEGFFIFEQVGALPGFPDETIQYLRRLLPHIRSAFIKTRLLDDLRKLNETKNEFLGMAAHDLRSPLGAIIGYLENMVYDLKTGQFDSVQATKDMEDLVRIARKMIHLITNLLDLSAIEAGKIELDLHRVNLSDILDESIKLHDRTAQHKKIRLIVEKKGDLPAVIADSLRLSEVVDNLLSNALKFTYAGGEVRVFCEVHSDEVITNISDTGQGIDENDLEKLFKGFAKLGSKPTGGELSTGLGLAIVKKVVELHGGRVWVISRKGQGSVFSFSLPVARSA